jgi:hypothetical protein
MQAWPHQLEIARRGLDLLKKYLIVYLAMEERTGKTLTAILMAEDTNVKNVLVITKKKAIISEDKKSGWLPTIASYPCKKHYEVISYQSTHKVTVKPDLVILDEAHSFVSGYPKRSKTWMTIRKLCKGVPIIYLSATPKAQGNQMLFNQFALSDWSPWDEYSNYYEWFKYYAERDKEGNVKTVKINSMDTVVDYSAVRQEDVWDYVKHLFITKTRKELGFEKEPEDVLHYVTLSDSIRDVYNHLLKHKLLDFTHSATGRDYKLVCDSPIKLRWALHMLEGGTLKIGDEYIDLGNTEKVDYILKTWGDTDDIVIMYQYKADKVKLEKYFANASLLQATSYAEGVDLSGYKDLIIYSQDFSTAKHTQRRARQANKERDTDIKVHFILVKKAVSEQVYRTVSENKKDFVDSTFIKEEL